MHRSYRLKHRKAIVMWIVLSISVVMGILMFSFNMIVRQRNAQAHLVYYGQVAYGLAESGMNLSWNNILDMCHDENSALYQLLIQTDYSNFQGQTINIALDPQTLSLLLKDLKKVDFV